MRINNRLAHEADIMSMNLGKKSVFKFPESTLLRLEQFYVDFSLSSICRNWIQRDKWTRIGEHNKGVPGEIMSYCARDKTAPSRPNSGFDAVKLTAKSHTDSKKGT